MQYLGGKSRIAAEICKAVLANTRKRHVYLEPFLGGGAVFYHMSPHFQIALGGDAHEDLMLMWQAAAEGWEPPETMSETEYYDLKRSAPSPLRGFAGFGCSFGGKWWGGYARQARGYNYAKGAKNSICKIARTLPPNREGFLKHAPYEFWDVNEDFVVYADPPYQGTTKYSKDLNHDAFWNKMREWSDRGATVFISEYRAPDDWVSIWNRGQKVLVSGGTSSVENTEHLFVRAA